MNFDIGRKCSFDMSDGVMIGTILGSYFDWEQRRVMKRVLVSDFGEVLVPATKCFAHQEYRPGVVANGGR